MVNNTEIQKGLEKIQSKLSQSQELNERDFIIALTAALVEELAQDFKREEANDKQSEA